MLVLRDDRRSPWQVSTVTAPGPNVAGGALDAQDAVRPVRGALRLSSAKESEEFGPGDRRTGGRLQERVDGGAAGNPVRRGVAVDQGSGCQRPRPPELLVDGPPVLEANQNNGRPQRTVATLRRQARRPEPRGVARDDQETGVGEEQGCSHVPDPCAIRPTSVGRRCRAVKGAGCKQGGGLRPSRTPGRPGSR